MNKLVVFTLFLLSILFLSGCGAIGKMQSGACSAFSEGSNMEEHCYQDAAVRAGIPDICSKITGSQFTAGQGNPRRNKCYRRVAIKLGDETICERLTPGSMAESKDGCYVLVALNEFDLSICDNINDNFMKEDCLKKVEAKFPYCKDEVNEEKTNECILETAIKQEKLSYCDRHENPSLCVIGFNSDLSKSDEIISIKECKSLNDPDGRNTCTLLYSYDSGDDAHCGSVPDPIFSKLCTSLSWNSLGDGDDPYEFLIDDTRQNMASVCDSMDVNSKWTGVCYGMLAHSLEMRWDDGVENSDFDPGSNVGLKQDLYKSYLKMCNNKELIGSDKNEVIETMCLLKTFTLSDVSVCSELEGDAKQECEVIGQVDTGVCIHDIALCEEILLPIHKDVKVCREKMVDGVRSRESFYCEQRVKSAHAIKLYSVSKGVRSLNGVPIETVTDMIVEDSLEYLEEYD